MYLEPADYYPSFPDVTEEQLREAFRKGHGEYIILFRENKRGGNHFIQAGGEAKFDGPYDLEYREGDNEHHFRATGEYTKAQVEQAFVWYLNGDDRWRTDYPWEKIQFKPWWKFW